MKYITKDIYNAMQRTDMHLLLQTLSNVNIYSEELYNKLYKIEEEKWLDLWKNVEKVDLVEVFSQDETDPAHADGTPMSKEEIEDAKEQWEKMKEQMIKNYVPYVFDYKKEKNNFDKRHQSMIKDLQKKLPKEILEEVADIRVLALNYSTEKIKEKIKDYCKEQMQEVNQAFDNYYKYYNETFPTKEDEVFCEHLHDAQIIDYKKDDKNLELHLHCSNVSQIIFNEYKIIKVEKDLKNTYWLYDELYKTSNGYELHVLLSDEKNKLIDFIISFSNIQIIK